MDITGFTTVQSDTLVKPIKTGTLVVKEVVKESKQLYKMTVLVDTEEEFKKAKALLGIGSEDKNVLYND
jgi:hypothetical protein